jgi:hypothetical protein
VITADSRDAVRQWSSPIWHTSSLTPTLVLRATTCHLHARSLRPFHPCTSLRRAAARTATAAAAALLGLLPAGASRAAVAALASAAEGVGYDLDFDGASPEVLEVMFVVVATYFGLMVLYIWLASMIDEVGLTCTEMESTVCACVRAGTRARACVLGGGSACGWEFAEVLRSEPV